MARIPLIFSLIFSFFLILGAFWFRFFNDPPPRAELVAVSQALNDSLNYDPADISAGKGTPNSPGSINTTDLAGRQLFSEYFSLASQNQSTSANLLNLAQKYAQNLSMGSVNARSLSLEQITVVPNSKESLLSYNKAITSIRTKYGAMVVAASQGKDLADVEKADFALFMSEIGKLYEASANELVLVKTPQSLAVNHLELINNYLETAEATKGLGKISKDPLSAYNAMNIYAQNADREATLLLNIQVAVISGGGFLGDDI